MCLGLAIGVLVWTTWGYASISISQNVSLFFYFFKNFLVHVFSLVKHGFTLFSRAMVWTIVLGKFSLNILPDFRILNNLPWKLCNPSFIQYLIPFATKWWQCWPKLAQLFFEKKVKISKIYWQILNNRDISIRKTHQLKNHAS